MNAWDFAVFIVSRIPFERLFVRDGTKSLGRFAQTIQERPPLPATESPPLPQTSVRQEEQPPTVEPVHRAKPLPAKEHLPKLDLPTTEETIQELKRRLGKELYRLELDLQAGGRIAGKPCDCLSKKHNLGLEAIAEELMAYETNPVYGCIARWLEQHEKEFEPKVIAEHPPEYYQQLIPEVRQFRKEVMGTEKLPTSIEEKGGKNVKRPLAEEDTTAEVEGGDETQGDPDGAPPPSTS